MKYSRELLILTAILVLGSFLRVLYVCEIVRNPDFSNPGVDAGYHDYWARGLAAGNWSVPERHSDPEIRTTPYFRPPGYPYFLALVYLLTDSSYLAVRILQIVLGMVGCLLAFHLGRKWFGGTVGLVFSALMATYWVFIYFEGELLEPVLLVGLGLLLVYALSLWTEEITFRRSLVAGVVFGLFALVRPNILLFGPAVLGWILWIDLRRGNLRQFGVGASGFILGGILMVIPATVRNYVVAREFVPISSNAGINLFIGNNEFARGFCTSRIRGLGRFETCYDYPGIVGNLEKKKGRRLKYSEVSAYFTREALGYMRAHPLRVVSLTWKRTLLFWGPREVSHNKEASCERAHSRVLRNLPVNFPMVLSLSVVGGGLALLAIRRQGRRKEESPVAPAQKQFEVYVLILLFLAAYFASYLLFFAAARYRVPIIPFLMLFASYAVVAIGQFIVRREFRRAGYWLIVSGALYSLAAVNFAGYEPDPAKWHFDRGVDYSTKGQMELAIREYSEAVRIKPQFSQAHSNLGLLLADEGRLDEAILHCFEALKIRPDDYWALYGVGLVLARQGKTDEAMKKYREAIRLEPRHAPAHYELGVCLLERGKPESAISHFLETLRIRPDDERAHYGLGVAFETQGKLDQAVEHYSAGLRINPSVSMHNRLAGIFIRQGKLEEVIREYRAAIRLQSGDPVMHYNLGVALDRTQKLDEAIRHYSEAVRIKPDYARAHGNLAVGLHRKGNYAEAWKEVRLCRKHGGTLHPDFLADLSRRMPEPRD